MSGVEKRNFRCEQQLCRLGRSESESVILDGLVQTAQSSIRFCKATQIAVSFLTEPRYRIAGLPVLGMGTMKPPKNDVGIGENVHY